MRVWLRNHNFDSWLEVWFMLQGNLLKTTVLRVFLITGIKRNSSNQIKSWLLGEELPSCPCHSSSGAQAMLYQTCAGNHLQEGVEALPGTGPAGGSFQHNSLVCPQAWGGEGTSPCKGPGHAARPPGQWGARQSLALTQQVCRKSG